MIGVFNYLNFLPGVFLYRTREQKMRENPHGVGRYKAEKRERKCPDRRGNPARSEPDVV